MSASHQWMRFDFAEFWLCDRVERLSMEQAGLLLFLLGREWITGPLPDEPEFLRKLTRDRVRDWETAWPAVQPFFERTSEGRLACRWVEDQRKQADERCRERVASGRRGGRSRSVGKSSSQASLEAKPQGEPEPELEAKPARSPSEREAHTDVRTNETDASSSAPRRHGANAGGQSARPNLGGNHARLTNPAHSTFVPPAPEG
jgi:uncharacterized protein YdaU (DUF1376 family)